MAQSSELIVEELRPAPDPWSVAQNWMGDPGLIFFDSADRQSPLARFSYVAADPRAVVRLRVGDYADPFAELDRLLPRERVDSRPELPPFQGGVAGLFGYGLGRAIERLPIPPIDEFAVPDLAVGVYDWVISFDHAQNRAWLVSRNKEEFQRVRDRVASPIPSSTRIERRITPASQYPLPGHPGRHPDG